MLTVQRDGGPWMVDTWRSPLVIAVSLACCAVSPARGLERPLLNGRVAAVRSRSGLARAAFQFDQTGALELFGQYARSRDVRGAGRGLSHAAPQLRGGRPRRCPLRRPRPDARVSAADRGRGPVVRQRLHPRSLVLPKPGLDLDGTVRVPARHDADHRFHRRCRYVSRQRHGPDDDCGRSPRTRTPRCSPP